MTKQAKDLKKGDVLKGGFLVRWAIGSRYKGQVWVSTRPGGDFHVPEDLEMELEK